ncbi:MAG: class I SAM-dependent methyltransferase [Bryobacterales bacterium]|nr:class I SAM-dependent methyltransferase [Bryobacterales bacterium]
MGERLENDRNEVLEANRIYHRLLADTYDAEQTFVSHAYIQKFFLNDLDSILGGLQDRQRPLRILDCGAGTGNLTLKFLERGCHVTATDISPEMLNELKKKINPAHLSRFECHVQDIDSFLQGATENYDVVCSSSFLHHLPNYKETYRWMLRRFALREEKCIPLTSQEVIGGNHWYKIS